MMIIIVRWRLIVAGIVFTSCVNFFGCRRPTDAPSSSMAGRQVEAGQTVSPTKILFKDHAADNGLTQQHFSGATGEFLFCEILGSGVALFDYDKDGDLDVYVVQSEILDPEKSIGDCLFPLPNNQPAGNRLFRNELQPSGRLQFVDVTAESGTGVEAYGMGVAVGDYDNDGDDDLYVTNLTDDVLLENQGDGTFRDVTIDSGVDASTWSTSAAFLDFDADGDLDLYVTAYVAYSLEGDQVCKSANGNRDYCGPQNYQYLQDHLYRNEGNGQFVDVSKDMGIATVRGPGLGVTCADFNGDGWIDIFVANDGEANNVWMNQKGRSFEEFGMMSGTAFNRDGTAEASMGVSAGDYDGDGDEDLFMTHLINETNTLYENDGTGMFTDSTDGAGLGFGSRGMTGFGSAWFDYDNDSWLDLYIANGDVKVEELRSANSAYPFDQPNQLYRNLRNGKFEEVKEAGGEATSLSEISRGVAFGDIDNDGDTDFVVTNNCGPVRLFVNELGQDNHWVRFHLTGKVGSKGGIGVSTRSAYGARIAVMRDGEPPLWRRVHTDGSYLCASDPRVLVGLGSNPRVDTVGVVWPSGVREQWSNVEAGQQVDLKEGTGEPWPASE